MLCQASPWGSPDSGSVSASGILSGARVTARSRLRSADVDDSTEDTASPATSAMIMSVLNVDELAHDHRADDLKHDGQANHPIAERIRRQQLDRLGVGAQHQYRQHRR